MDVLKLDKLVDEIELLVEKVKTVELDRLVEEVEIDELDRLVEEVETLAEMLELV